MHYDTFVPNRFVAENKFIGARPEQAPLPEFQTSREKLPSPHWEGHQDVLDCYWKTWEFGFRNLRQPAPNSGFVSNFIDTAFNDCVYMWDSAFIQMFARYGARAFNFQGTLDNFYSHQCKDGYISREYARVDGSDRYERFDPSSTGPNIMPWAEWEYYLNFSDRDRLAAVFPPLLAYYIWFRMYRSWPDGTYWSSGWGSGMDNMPRHDPSGMREPYHETHWTHGHMSWLDITFQQILAARQLVAMAKVLGREEDVKDLVKEVDYLTKFTNEHLWDEAQSFYFDRWRYGQLSGVKSIAAYWSLLAEVPPPARVARLVQHLRNPAEFNRPHRVPSLSADDKGYAADGAYWHGGVWAPTNYVVLRGLTKVGEDALAHEIALNHLQNVVEVFKQSGTVYENYAPERATRGEPAKPDFVGWTGLTPVTIFFEYVLGVRADVPHGRILWDVRLLEEHGISRYPYGKTGMLDLCCAKRRSASEEPRITAKSNEAVDLVVQWEGGTRTIRCGN